MKRVVLGVLVLAVCGMMVAPMGMAGKPAQPSGKYSVFTGDFISGPTAGKWRDGNIEWHVNDGGYIKILNVPSGVSTTGYIEWNTHWESVIMFSPIPTKNGAPSWLPVNKLVAGTTYQCPGPVISDLHLTIHMLGWGPDGNVWLTALLDCHRMLIPGQTISVKATASQVIISGTNINFHYYDWSSEDAQGPPLKYGETNHDIVIYIDR